jgi:hypothetical protein
MNATLKDLKDSQEYLIEEMLVRVEAKIEANQDKMDV